MSFEGYYQVICAKGHYTVVDCYSFDVDEWKCSICNEPCAWSNIVDITNGSYEDDERIDGYIGVEIDKPGTYKVCECCGGKEIVEHPTYKIPKDR